MTVRNVKRADVCSFWQSRHDDDRTTRKHNIPNGTNRAPLTAQNGNATSWDMDLSAQEFSSSGDAMKEAPARSHSNEDTPDTIAYRSLDNEDDDEDDDGRLARGVGGFVHSTKRPKDGMEWSDEDSKWIHRDKLAKIESEELQAAGIILPQPREPRTRSKGPGRDRSQSSNRKPGADGSTRSRNNSSHALVTAANEDGADGDTPARPMTGSKIPVPKKSPGLFTSSNSRENSPEELDKDKPLDAPKTRSRSNSMTLKGLEPSATSKSTPGKKPASEQAGKRTTPPGGSRKPLAPSKTIPPEARGKPKPKGKNGANGNNGRPKSRSGERELSAGSLGQKQMEGEPPWMISAYKPDPRLPPDQQLLPTVAKRLAQEKWEQEGKFGSVYDKDFRPLTGEFLFPPGSSSPGFPPSSSTDDTVEQKIERPDEWPLKSPEAPKSPASIGRSSTYSTMPKIQDKPPSHSPLPSPREQQQQQPTMPSPPVESVPPRPPMQVTRVPDVEKVPSAKKKKEGCACCIVM